MQKETKRRNLGIPVKLPTKPPTRSQQMIAKIDNEQGRKQYSRRLAIVEPVFANIRTQKGLDHFTLRGKKKVNIQWLLYGMVHNIEKIVHYGEGRLSRQAGRQRVNTPLLRRFVYHKGVSKVAKAEIRVFHERIFRCGLLERCKIHRTGLFKATLSNYCLKMLQDRLPQKSQFIYAVIYALICIESYYSIGFTGIFRQRGLELFDIQDILDRLECPIDSHSCPLKKFVFVGRSNFKKCVLK